jgi:hypothetical protein
MDLERLVAALEPVEVLGGLSVEVRDLAYDARGVTPGALFFAVPGERADGHDFAAEAVERGAAALVVERRLDLPVPQVVVRDTRAAMAPAADVFFGEPTRELEVVGVTGTSGKTTTSFLLFAILAAAGPAARPARDRSRRAWAESGAVSCARHRRRSTYSACSARCSTQATARARWRRRRTPPSSTGSTGCASRC